jgi:hypothetical protein
VTPRSRDLTLCCRPRLAQNCRAATSPCQRSEIRLVCGRDSGVLSGEVFMPVFRADQVRPFAEGADT